jgi:ubiquinone biosynthesis protein
MPSLQKMGQILCRHPELDAEFRQALVELEDSLKNLSFDRLQPKLKQALLGMDSDHGIEAENKILAEASVCAVVPGKAAGSASGKTQSVVLKLVKPGIQENLARELSLLDRLAFYLAERQQDWGLENFQFQDTFRQVRWLLENEIDLTREQNNIRTAFGYYAAKSDVVIPELFSCSTPTMTVMSRVSGYKITAVNHLTDQQRRLLAQTLAKACILDPIQELRPTSIFHGDPHAGNIAYCFEGRHPQLIFYDWGMMGRLSRNERFDFSMLALGFLLKSVDIILHATNNITHGQVSCHEKQEAVIHRAINKVIASHGGNPTAVLGAIEKLFEELAYKGIVFSSNLFMYEKAQVTLKGIFAEIDPEFKMDAYLAWVSVGKFLSDIAHLRYHLVALEEAWRLYMRYFKQMMDLQKQLAGYMLKSG